jgi:glycosyltransferase involved in cell wall biosynthesis
MVLHVGMLTPSVSRRAGGLAPAISALSKALTQNGTGVTVFATRDPDTARDSGDWTEVELSLRDTSGPAAFGLQQGLLRDLRAAALDVVHLHGLWTYPSLAALKWSAGHKPRIVSPHGMLDPWALRNSGLKKKFVSALYEQHNLTGASCLHALCSAERDAIRGYGIKRPVAIIPNGVDLSIASGTFPLPEWYDRVPDGAKILLFLGRIHPKKGLRQLLDTLSRLNRGEADQWHLVIAGWDQDGTEEQLAQQATDLGIANRVHFVGPQFGAQKNATFAASDAFVLPSLSEGLPIAVLEAWAFSLPVLMTPACNLPEGFAAGAAIHLAAAPAEMADGLRGLASLSDAQLCKMGANGYDLVRNSFTWSAVARRMRETYDWVLGGRDRPDFIDLD